MLTRSFLVLAAGILPAVLGQTHSTCNPLKGCFQDNPALGGVYTWDYTKSRSAAQRFDVLSSASRITYEGDGMHMAVQMKGDSPTLQSHFYIFWGRLDVVMKAGPGAGIVSSLVFQSDDLDEIDVEFIGSQPGNVQTNIFSKGNQDVHIYGSNSAVDDAVGKFHTYTVDWTPEAITWSIDGAIVRTLTRASLGAVYPQTPMQIKFGPWAAGDPSNAPGTIEWAGGAIDYSQGPFDMVVASMTITDYSKGATKYRYKDTSGAAESIEITYGGNVDPVVPSSSASPLPPAPTTTSTPPKPKPTTTKSTPPPPPQTTSSKPAPSTSSSATSKSSVEPTTSSESSSSSSKPPKPSTKSTTEEDSTTTSRSSTRATFVVEPSETAETTKNADPTTLQTSIASVTGDAEPIATSTPPAGSGASNVRAGWSLIIAFGVLLVVF